tara:strand:- start:155 stop:322 length:168 start_codon:yes stop_codon:yes gene_type:complete
MIDRLQKQIIDYINWCQKKTKQMKFVRELKKEVDINGTGTHKYRVKEGPNKGKVL